MKKIYEKFVDFLSTIPVDKYIHCIVSMIVASILMHILPFGSIVGFVLSVLLAIAVGVAKELYDKKDYGLFDKKDIYADIIGAFIGTLMSA